VCGSGDRTKTHKMMNEKRKLVEYDGTGGKRERAIDSDPLQIICALPAVFSNKSSITDAVNLLDFCLIAYETFI
jgi:hypothetical protein